MATITARTESHSRKPFLFLAGGVLIVIAVAAGLGAWQYTNQDSDSQPAVGAAVPAGLDDTLAPAEPVASLVEQMRAEAQAAAAAAAGTRMQEVPTLYIVATDEDAALLRAQFEALDHPVRLYRVLVLAQPNDDAGIVQEMNRLRGSNGLPEIEVLDLRGR
jgi:hypothetical protein